MVDKGKILLDFFCKQIPLYSKERDGIKLEMSINQAGSLYVLATAKDGAKVGYHTTLGNIKDFLRYHRELAYENKEVKDK